MKWHTCFAHASSLYSPNIRPFFASLVFFVIAAYLMSVSQVYTQHRTQLFSHLKQRFNLTDADIALPDVGFDLLPSWNMGWWGWNGANLCLAVVVGFTVLRFAVTGMRITILRRCLLCWGTLLLLRGATIAATMLPNPATKTCDAAKAQRQLEGLNPWIGAFGVLSGRVVTCGDVLYSGHTVLMMISCLVWHTYSHVVPVVQNCPSPEMCGCLANLSIIKLIIWLCLLHECMSCLFG
eukprot:TRINITY_DN10429_c0_g1_i3.p1 TRINITY_DN10429_c0_g1~~TRINITY_DN10429_c0_g1_i3.p1  ORF type:complete len:256 (+),score=41.02 TRINITY_DN10429_c0_g1_i3:58-768(+)